MAVVGTASRIADGQSGDDLELGHKRMTKVYRVIVDNPYDGSEVVLSASGLPAIHDPYQGKPSALCVARYPKRVPKTHLMWHVEVQYDTNYTARDENPFTEKPEIEWGGEPYDEPLPGTEVKGADVKIPDGMGSDGKTKFITGEEFRWGAGILNSAGDPFDPPPTIPSYLPAIRFSRNEAAFTADQALIFGNSVNGNLFSGLYPHQAWLKPIEATHMVWKSDRFDTEDILYWRVRYTFVLKASTWDLQLLNIGPHYLTKANTDPTAQKVRFTDVKTGQPTMGLLKKDGTKFTDAERIDPAQCPTFAVYQVRRSVDWSPLMIDLNLNLSALRQRRQFDNRSY